MCVYGGARGESVIYIKDERRFPAAAADRGNPKH